MTATATYVAGQTGGPVQVATGQSVTLSPVSSSAVGYVEYTTVSAADLANGLASWQPWTVGIVNGQTGAKTDRALSPIFVRAVINSGSCTLTIADGGADLTIFGVPWASCIVRTPIVPNSPRFIPRDYALSNKYWNIETKRQSGSGMTPGNSVNTNKDFRIVGTAEQHWDAVRLHILNYETANSVQGYTANFAPTANMTTPNTPTGTWTTFTWASAGSVNLSNATAGSGGTPKPIPSISSSDWMSGANVQSVARNDGGTYPMWMITQHNPVGPGTYTYTFEAQSSTSFDTDGLTGGRRFYKMFQGSIDGVTTPANFTTSTESNNCNPFIIQFRSRGRVASLMCSGDSIVGGSGTTSNMLSAGFLAAIGASSTTFPVQYLGAGYASRFTVDTLAEAKAFISAVNPHMCAYSVYSPNDGAISSTIVNTQLRQAMDFVQHCRANDCVPILITPTPDNSDSIASSVLKIGLTNTLLALRSQGVLVADWWTAVSEYPGANVSTGYGWKSGYNADTQHPSDTGAAVMASVLRQTITPVLQANS